LFDRLVDAERRIYSVSELTRLVKSSLEERFGWVWVVGEISNLRRPRSGHHYFTLKDERAQLRAVMWRPLAARLRFDLADGMEVIVGGGITVYEPRGEYQIIVEALEPRGIGALELAFQQLKEKLAAEGLFDAAHKKPIPMLPRHVAIVTSPTGAAIRDILQIINRRFPRVRLTLYPVAVQGEGAAEEIAHAIGALNRLGGFDVMITGRGGGSLEDLWAFNEEVVARAIFASRVPVISAVGHEIDTTISDLVADVRARTPSEAAELVVPDEQALVSRLESLRDKLVGLVRRELQECKAKLAGYRSLLRPRLLVEAVRLRQQHVDDISQRLQLAVARHLERCRHLLEALAGKLEHLSPLKVLARGYSITRKPETGEVIKAAAQVSPGEKIQSLLARGSIASRVESVTPRHPFETESSKEQAGEGKEF
jgi:exodeoxyribonuclease VII large subunit